MCVRVCVAGCVCVGMLHIKFAVFWIVWCFEAACGASCDASSAAFRPPLKSMQHFQIKFWAFYAIMHAIAVECGDCCLRVLQVQRAANECRCGCGARLCIALLFDSICGHPNLQLPFLFFFFCFKHFFPSAGWPLMPLQLNYDTTGYKYTHTRAGVCRSWRCGNCKTCA